MIHIFYTFINPFSGPLCQVQEHRSEYTVLYSMYSMSVGVWLGMILPTYCSSCNVVGLYNMLSGNVSLTGTNAIGSSDLMKVKQISAKRDIRDNIILTDGRGLMNDEEG